jgi:thymidylate synthase (FAD)
MQVKLIARSMPAVEGVTTSEELLAYCARVSAAANQHRHDTGWKLLRRLIRFKEWSPLDMVSMTIEVDTTRDVARQMLRHWSFRFQEFSQRYAEVGDDPVFREARMQDPKDRQGSVPCDDETIHSRWRGLQQQTWWTAIAAYKWAIAVGISKEVARVVLPEGMTKSRLYMQGTLRSFVHYCQLRTQPSTQKEHREVAFAVLDIIEAEYPSLFEAMREAA